MPRRPRPPLAPEGPRGLASAPREILATARRILGRDAALHYHPDIPSPTEAAAREVHAYLPDTETVLVLYDATLLETGENGFVVTADRLCWKNLFDHPRQLAWGELDPASVVAESGSVGMAGGIVTVKSHLTRQVAGFLAEMASRRRLAPAGPYRVAALASEPRADRAPHAVSHITTLARRYLGEADDVYYHPAIPPQKLRRARTLYKGRLEPGEVVAVLYDDTVFGGAEEGFVITPRRLCWKNLLTLPATIAWDAIDPARVAASANVVHVMGGAVHLTAQSEIVAPVAALVAELSREARR